MSALTRREPRSLFPDLFDWLDSPGSMLRQFMAQPMRLEDYVEGHCLWAPSGASRSG
jgi:HSP20 family protein